MPSSGRPSRSHRSAPWSMTTKRCFRARAKSPSSGPAAPRRNSSARPPRSCRRGAASRVSSISRRGCRRPMPKRWRSASPICAPVGRASICCSPRATDGKCAPWAGRSAGASRCAYVPPCINRATGCPIAATIWSASSVRCLIRWCCSALAARSSSRTLPIKRSRARRKARPARSPMRTASSSCPSTCLSARPHICASAPAPRRHRSPHLPPMASRI